MRILEELPAKVCEGGDLRRGAIHIELPGEIRISLEGGVDQDLVRAVLKSLRT